MAVGRKVIPIGIKKAKGTNQKCRERVVPIPSEKTACPPRNLNARARQIFQHLVKNRLSHLGLASASHTESIAVLAKRMERLEVIDKFIDDHGVSYEVVSETGVSIFKPYPEAVIQKDLARHVQSLLAEFGLSPASAQKVGTKKPKQEQNDFDQF